jgi:hypothetical protein
MLYLGNLNLEAAAAVKVLYAEEAILYFRLNNINIVRLIIESLYFRYSTSATLSFHYNAYTHPRGNIIHRWYYLERETETMYMVKDSKCIVLL